MFDLLYPSYGVRTPDKTHKLRFALALGLRVIYELITSNSERLLYFTPKIEGVALLFIFGTGK